MESKSVFIHAIKKYFAGVLVAVQFFVQVPLGTLVLAQPNQANEAAQTEMKFLAKERDWAAIDWDATVVTLADAEAFARERQELADAGKRDQARALTPSRRGYSDETVMATMGVPAYIQALVRPYADGKKGATAAEQAAQKQTLAAEIRALTGVAGLPAAADAKQLINLKTAKRLKNMRAIPMDPEKEKMTVRVTERRAAPKSERALEGVTVEQLMERALKEQGKSAPSKRTSFWHAPFSFMRELIGGAPAHAGTPVIAYYDGIEKHPLDYTLYAISERQNADGSFGETAPYETTFRLVMTLNTTGRTANDQYGSALNYLLNTTPQNNREKALKARILTGTGQSATALLDEIAQGKNDDGGYGFQAGYESDAQTTLEVALAMYAANYSLQDRFKEALLFVLHQIPSNGELRYTDDGNPSYFLINKIAQDLWPLQTLAVSDGQTNITVQSRIDALLGYLRSQWDTPEGRLLGSGGVMDEIMTLETWRLYGVEQQYYAVLRAKVLSEQQASGLFDGAVYPSLYALQALALPDLALTDLTSVGTLRNKSSAVFTVTLTNTGYAPSATTTLRFISDNFLTNHAVDLLANNIRIGPNETVVLDITISQNDTLTGNTDITLYADGSEELEYDNNWISRQFIFATAENGSPALPVYYIAQQYEMNNEPALNVRWQRKADPQRLNYIIMIRPKGAAQWDFIPIDNTWNGAFMSGGLPEGAVYEVTAGVVHQDGQTVTFSTALTEVRLTSDPSKYNGSVAVTVQNAQAAIPGVSLFAYSSSGQTNGTGAVTLGDVRNGTNAIQVVDKMYENIWTKFTVGVGSAGTVVVPSRLKEDTQPPTITSAQILFRPNFKVINQSDVIVNATTADNVQTKEVDFYLWHPRENSWLFLGTQATTNSGADASFPWYVPADVMGTGFKIKAIAYDYRGNTSAPREWGPFEGVDGTTPTFTVTAPAANAVWAIGSARTITWTSSSTNPITTVAITARYPGGGSEYLSSGAPNTGSFIWNIPTSTTYVSDSVVIEVKGTDPVNFRTGSGSSAPVAIGDGTPSPALPWARPDFVSTTTGASDVGSDTAALAVDAAGRAHLVYRKVVDDFGSPARTITQQLWYQQYDNGNWSAARKFYEETSSVVPNLSDYYAINNIRLAIDGTNRLHLVWNKQANGDCSTMNNQEIYYLYFDGVTASAVVNISNNVTESSYPQIAIGSDGKAQVAWVDGTSWDSNCNATGGRSIRYRDAIGGVWGATETVPYTPEMREVRLVVTADNKAHLFYNAERASYNHLIRENGGWSQPTVALAGTDVRQVEVAARHNTLYLVSNDFGLDGATQQNRYRLLASTFNGVWSSTTEITTSSAGDELRSPRMVVDKNGTPHILFEKRASDGRYPLYWTTKIGGASWLAPQELTLTSQNTFKDSSHLAYLPLANKLLATWVNDYNFGEGRLVYNTADLSSTSWRSAIMYEDVEDGDTAGWFITPPTAGATASIAAVSENAGHGKVIDMKTGKDFARYVFYTPQSNPWLYPQYPVLQWEMKYSQDPTFMIYLNTSQGVRYVNYGTAVTPGLVGDKLYFKLDSSFKDGAWHTLTRNLQQDVDSLLAGATVQSIGYFSAIGTGKIDNIQLLREQPLGTISGQVTDSENKPIGDVYVRASEYPVTVKTDAQGKYALPGVPAGSYTLTAEKAGFIFTPTTTVFDGVATTLTRNFVAVNDTFIVYEDAEDGNTVGWSITPNTAAATAVVTTTPDDPLHGKVIDMRTGKDFARYVFYAPQSNPWRYPDYSVLQWEMKYVVDMTFLIYLNTSAGVRYLNYSTANTPGVVGDKYYFKLDSSFKDGTWKTLSRNLQQDVRSLDPAVTVTSIGYFSAVGTGKIDNIRLVRSLPLATVRGAVTDVAGQPLPDALITASSYGIVAKTDANGMYRLPGLPVGNYTLAATKVGYAFPTTPITITSSTNELTRNFQSGSSTSFIVYEDSEDGDTVGWSLTPPTASTTGAIAAVNEDVTRGKVLEMKTGRDAARYVFYTPLSNPWRFPDYPVLKWETKYAEDPSFIIYLNTSAGVRYLSYSTRHQTTRLNYVTVEVPLAATYKDGTWRTLERNLQQDLAAVLPTTTIQSIGYFSAVGTGRLDGIQLVK